jgi:prepilin-type N-terminal cleavage/methylation domain-containing protein
MTLHHTTAAVRPAPPRRRLGFTLIEMLVIIVLLGILAGISLSKLDFTRMRVNTESMHLGSELAYAQRLAISLQHDVHVQFDPATNSFAMHEDANNDGVVQLAERVRRTTLEQGVVFGRGAAAILPQVGGADIAYASVGGFPTLDFRRDGSANQSGGVYLTSVRAAGGASDLAKDAVAIEVIRSTGRLVRWRFSSGTWKAGN